MDGVAAAKKGERKIDELFGYRQLELAAPETRTAPGQAGGRQAGGVATVVLIVPGSGEDGRKVSLRSERSPNVSDCSDPISIIIIVVAVAVIQFGSRRRDADAITGGRRGATVLRIYFNLTATAEGSGVRSPICPRLATGVLQGSPMKFFRIKLKASIQISPPRYFHSSWSWNVQYITHSSPKCYPLPCITLLWLPDRLAREKKGS